MRIVSRKDWGARPPKARTSHTLTASARLFFHWSAGQGRDITSKAKQAMAMRAIQRLHMDERGWSDIAYSYVVFQPYGLLKRVRIFEARSFGYVPAAQEGHNTGNGAVCVVMAPGESLKPATKRKLRALYARFPGNSVSGHRDVNSTSCPGDLIYAEVQRMKSDPPRKKTRLP